MHPQPRVRFVVLVCTRVFTAEAPETSGIPHAMVLTAYLVLCPGTAGESHVGGAKLLRGNENLILTVSADSIGELFGPLCRLLFAVGRSSEEPSAARSDRDTVHCVARHAVRCHDLLRHRAVWAIERSSVAHDSGAGARDTEPRHLQPCLSHPRSEQLRRGVS